MTRPRAALAALWVGAVAAVAAGWTGLVLHSGIDRINSGQAVFLSLCALAAPVLATAMHARHPAEATGPLLGFALLAAMLAACRTTDLGAVAPVAGAAALVLAALPAAVVAHYPALAIPRRVVTAVSGLFGASAALGLVLVLLLGRGGVVPTTVWFTASPGPFGTGGILLVVHATLVCSGPLLLLGSTALRHASPTARAAARPVSWPLTCWTLALVAGEVWTVALAVAAPTRDLSDVADTTIFVILPAFLVSALAAGMAWTDLAVRVPTSASGAPTPSRGIGDVEHYLALALADPSIRVLYRVDHEESWVSATGRIEAADASSEDRATTVIVRGRRLIGLIDQDAASTAHPDAVELVATGAGLSMETERLRAAAARDLERARLLAQRLLVASDAPRSALRDLLLAGPLADLDEIAHGLASGTPVSAVVTRLTAVAARVRSISHGVLPTALASGGLRAALEGHAVPDRRYAPVIEMTSYLAAAADPSASIEETIGEDGPRLAIRTRRPPTTDVIDRVTTLGGAVAVHDGIWTVEVPAEPDTEHR
jgi:hypothetical protein